MKEQYYALSTELVDELVQETTQQLDILNILISDVLVKEKDDQLKSKHLISMLCECYVTNFNLSNELSYLKEHVPPKKTDHGDEIVLAQEAMLYIETAVLTRYHATSHLQQVFNISTALH